MKDSTREAAQPQEFFRVNEASDRYRISEPLLRKKIREGDLRVRRVRGARVVLIPRSELERMLGE